MNALPQGCSADVSPSRVIIELDQAVYRLSAAKKAAYKFTDQCYAQLAVKDGGYIQVILDVKDVHCELPILAREFCNEVLDQELREVVAEETRPIRDLLLAQAFSAASLVDEHADEGDYHVDPMGIRKDTEQ